MKEQDALAEAKRLQFQIELLQRLIRDFVDKCDKPYHCWQTYADGTRFCIVCGEFQD